MDLSEIVSITGMPGLYKVTSQRSNGVIVKSLIDDSSKFIPARLHSISPLENITIYVMDADGNRELSKVFEAMQKAEEKHPVVASNCAKDELLTYFKSVVPDYDEEQVYNSDIKKIVKWYTLLKSKNLLKKASSKKKEKASSEEE